MQRRSLVLAAAAAGAAAISTTALAQDGTVKIIVGYPPGATSDLLTRLLAEHMAGSLRQTVIVENRAGAGGRIANEAVKAAPKDGLTLLMTPIATMGIFPHSYAGNLRYDPLKDFAPVTHLTDFQVGLGVANNVPAQTLAEYVAWVKKDPAKNGFYGSAAPGSIPHFFGVMFARTAGIELTHVPYKGTAAVMQAISAGEISAISTTTADIMALVKGQKARLLAVGGRKRDPALPAVPTFKEQGYDLVAAPWYALFAPTGTPAAAIERLSKAAVAAMQDPALRKRLDDMGLDPTGYGPEQLGRILKADYDRWGEVIRSTGFKGD